MTASDCSTPAVGDVAEGASVVAGTACACDAGVAARFATYAPAAPAVMHAAATIPTVVLLISMCLETPRRGQSKGYAPLRQPILL